MRGRPAVLLSLAVLAAATSCGDGSAQKKEAKAAPEDDPSGPTGSPLPSNPIARERAELDRSVWEAEVAAQEHERTFVALWDAMRAAEDPAVPLSQLRFKAIRIPTLSPPVELGDGTRQWSADREGEDQRPESYRAFVAELGAAGWKLEQSEWHHANFEPGRPAFSEVAFLLHAKRDEPPARVAIEGKLAVSWSDDKDGELHLIDLANVIELSITERAGPAAFSKVRTFEPGPDARAPQVQPVLVHDLDRDGRPDVILAGANRVFYNRGNFEFEDGPLLENPAGFLTSAALGDLDGDGHVDLLAGVAGGPPLFFKGDASGHFSEMGREAASLPAALINPLSITLGDIDADGDLDAFISQYKRPYVMGQMPTPYYDANDGFAAYLLVNDGNAVFEDRTEAAGLVPKRYRRTYSAAFTDLDDDRDLDLLVVSDFSGIDVYHNDGNGEFSDVTKDLVDERASFGMSMTMGDYDLDGDRDLYVVGMSSTTARRLDQLKLGRGEFTEHQEMRGKMAFGNRMYLRSEDNQLKQARFGATVARTGWSWGSTSFDFDRDGDLDIYVANGNISRGSAQDYCTTFWRHDIYSGSSEINEDLNGFFLEQFDQSIAAGVSWNGYEHNKLFSNSSGRGFEQLGYPLGVALEDDGRGVISTDLNDDGRVDLLVVLSQSVKAQRGEMFHEKLALLRNDWDPPEGSPPHHWLGVRLAGPTNSVGAKIRIKVGDQIRQHEVIVGDSLLSQHAPERLFGLGEASKVDWVEIEWVGGKRKKLSNPKIDRWHRVK
jgi:hypothetical protein